MKKITRSSIMKFLLFVGSFVCAVMCEYWMFVDYFYGTFGMNDFFYAAYGISAILLLVALLCVAAKRPDTEEIKPGLSNYIPTDIMIALEAFIISIAICFSHEFLFCEIIRPIHMWMFFALFYPLMVLTILFDFAGRIKSRTFFKNTVIAACFRLIGKFFKLIIKGIKIIPFIWRVVLLTVGISILELVFFGFCWFEMDNLLIFWFLEKIVMVPAIFYAAWNFHVLKTSAAQMAQGRIDQGVDARKMFWGFKEHAQSLNQLMGGINVAVAERMKSERMKTELITNVSHDIKTPLTSIINYSDLLCREVEELVDRSESIATNSNAIQKANAMSNSIAENGTTAEAGVMNAASMMADTIAMNGADIIADAGVMDRSGDVNVVVEDAEISVSGNKVKNISEYSEVIHRQSGRLKRLLEDLLEVSKANSGNIETNLVECEADILLSQAVGEFEDKLNAAQLIPIMSLPEIPIKIMADRLHLWRVFDNLLNNICKYAMPGTRVFFSAELVDGMAVIKFRNTSKDLLNINANDLTERFVRGDSSRTSSTEGHGLGLAIAQSLTELMGGQLELATDADLFTAVLKFKAC